MEHGLKDIAFYVQNIQQFELSCQNFPLVRDKPPGGARICETGLLVQIMDCRQIGAKPLCEPMLGYYQLNPWEQTSVKF